MDRRRYLASYRAAMTAASISRTRVSGSRPMASVLCVPNEKLRQMTEGRDARSLALPPQTATAVTLNCELLRSLRLRVSGLVKIARFPRSPQDTPGRRMRAAGQGDTLTVPVAQDRQRASQLL